MCDRLAFNARDCRALEEYARTCGADLEGLSEVQRQILLLICGCCKIRRPERVHLMVAYDGGMVEKDRPRPALEDLKRATGS